MHAVEIIEVDDSLGFIFPPEVIEKYQLKVGDDIYLVETDDGFEIRLQNTEPTSTL